MPVTGQVHLVVPAGYDDPARPSGGNRYDQEVLAGLRALRRRVVPLPVRGDWPEPAPAAVAELARRLAEVPDAGLVLVDGLVGSAAPEPLEREARRLRLLPLVHMPLGQGRATDDVRARERAALATGRLVVATSAWTADWLVGHGGVPAERVRTVPPGVHAAPPARAGRRGHRLLTVAAVTRGKGHGDLVDALAGLGGRPVEVTFAGPLTVEPGFVADLRARVTAAGLAERVRFAGPLTGPALAAAYDAADLLVLPSYAETFGMVVTEALAHGVPVLASDVGGIPEALGTTAAGRPGLLVPPGDVAALAGSLARWLDDPGLRARLRDAARERRRSLRPWSATAVALASVLDEAARVNLGRGGCVSPDERPTRRPLRAEGPARCG